jgi:hypothetical protein
VVVTAGPALGALTQLVPFAGKERLIQSTAEVLFLEHLTCTIQASAQLFSLFPFCINQGIFSGAALAQPCFCAAICLRQCWSLTAAFIEASLCFQLNH